MIVDQRMCACGSGLRARRLGRAWLRLLWLCLHPAGHDHGPGLRRALRCSAGPFAQALDVARLREVEHREDGQPGHRGQACDRPDFLDDFRQGFEG